MRRVKKFKPVMMVDIPLTPLIDTALTLLVIFMVVGASVKSGIAISLPKSAVNNGIIKKELIVTIDQKGKYYWNDRCVTKDQLLVCIRNEPRNPGDTVVIKADGQVAYQAVIDIFELLSEMVGIDDVVLSTEKR